jgi:hypothetical protein
MPTEDISQLERELKIFKSRLEIFKKQSLSPTDDTPNTLDSLEQARVRECETIIAMMEERIRKLKAHSNSIKYESSGGIMHEDTWDNAR